MKEAEEQVGNRWNGGWKGLGGRCVWQGGRGECVNGNGREGKGVNEVD